MPFEELMESIQNMCVKLAKAGHQDAAVEIIENTLGVGQKVANCTKRQTEALTVIYDELKEKLESLK